MAAIAAHFWSPGEGGGCPGAPSPPLSERACRNHPSANTPGHPQVLPSAPAHVASTQKGDGSFLLPCWKSPVTAALLSSKIKPLLFIPSTHRSLRIDPGGTSTLNTQVAQTFVKYWHGLAGDLEQSQDLVILSWVDNLLSE